MEGLYACVRGKHAWRWRCSQASGSRRRLLGGVSDDDGCCYAMGQGQREILSRQGTPMPPRPSMEVALGQELLLLPSDGTRPVSHQELQKKEKSFTYLRNVRTSSKTKELEVSMLKFKGILGKSSILEETRSTVTNATTLHVEKDTEYIENRGALLLSVKGISSPLDPLCDCVASTKPDGTADINKDGQAVRSINVEKSLTQLFVKVCQKEVSMQEDFNTTTIKELIDSACRKAGIQACDFYAVYGGKRLKADKPIAYYPIFKDSTIHLRSRLRAGDRMYSSVTFEELMNNNMHKRYRQVALSPLSINQKTNKSSVTFLSHFSAYYIHRIMVYICDKHRRGESFDGKFTAKDILIINHTMVDFDTSNLQDYDFTEQTCSNDYATLLDIFTTYFTEGGIATAVYFQHFLDYLFDCPAKAKSNSEPVIQFITNHPALTSYMDRIKQCDLLDSMVRRLDANGQSDLGTACSEFASWVQSVLDVPALKTVYNYNSKYDPIKKISIVNPEYTIHNLGCLRFARNYFSHADYQMKLLEVEAAFAETLQHFLPTILLEVAMGFEAPTDFDILTLLGNPLADSFK